MTTAHFILIDFNHGIDVDLHTLTLQKLVRMNPLQLQLYRVVLRFNVSIVGESGGFILFNRRVNPLYLN